MLPFGRNWKSELLSTCNAVRIPLPSQEVGPEYIRSGRCILLHVIKHNLAAKQNLKARCVRTGLGDPAVAGPILYYYSHSVSGNIQKRFNFVIKKKKQEQKQNKFLTLYLDFWTDCVQSITEAIKTFVV